LTAIKIHVRTTEEVCRKQTDMQTEALTQSLIEQTRQLLNEAEKLKACDDATLNRRSNESSWSILECLEHLNLYGDFYLPQIEEKIRRTTTTSEPAFRSGRLGNYFAQSMLPKEKLNKMKTFKDKNPIHSKLDRAVIDRFIGQQVRLLDLLDRSRRVSLNKVRIETTLTRLIRLKLGDAFSFLINHMIRHFSQIKGIQEELKISAPSGVRR